VLGFFLASSITALYAVVPKVFPVAVRTTGTGMAMSFGRVGAAAGPYIAGLLMASGMERPQYCLLMAIPVFLAALTLRWMTPIPEDAVPLPEDGGAGKHVALGARASVT
jgi:MFS family permease